MFLFTDLRDELAQYLEPQQVAQITEAYLLAAEAHEGQYRQTGEPYITHPIEVARILARMRMDYQSIMAAMLHDVLEDTSVDKATLGEKFGEPIALLVDGVSKLEQIKFESRAEAQAENFRKMVMAMVRDIRVILIKLSDRLHNMRTLSALSRDKRQRIARETLEIYGPIANRLGMNNFRVEFEDLGFAAYHPMRYRVLREAVRRARGNRKELMSTIETALREALAAQNISPDAVIGREKHLYSIYKKMRNRRLPFSEVMDVYAFRVIVDEVDTCYRVLGLVHNLYKPVPGRFKDYVAIPKANGYQSLHTILFGPFGVPIEIQIRTHAMHRMAENGIAAHWLYKSSASAEVNKVHARTREWLRGLLDMQKRAGNSLEFIENVKVDLFPDEVYVFTPDGDIMELPSGATAVDFAYAVHTDVGNSCVGVRLDRQLAPLSAVLVNGHSVEIITAPGARPNPSWLNFVVTGKARGSIRHFLKNQRRDESINLGRRLLETALSRLSLKLDILPTATTKTLCDEFQVEAVDDIFEQIGLGNRMAMIVAKRIMALLAVKTDVSAPPVPIQKDATPLLIKGSEGMVLHFARCCWPIPGDPILGFISAGQGLTVHQESCKNIVTYRDNPERYINLQWQDALEGEFQVEIRIDVVNKRGMLATLATAISDCESNIDSIRSDDKDGRYSVVTLVLSVRDRGHLARIMRRIRNIDVVSRIARSR